MPAPHWHWQHVAQAAPLAMCLLSTAAAAVSLRTNAARCASTPSAWSHAPTAACSAGAPAGAMAVAAFVEAWPPLGALVAAALPGPAAAGAGLRAEAARCCTQALRANEAAAAAALPAAAAAAGAAFALPGGHAFAAPLAAALDLLACWRAGRGPQRGPPLPAPLMLEGVRAARLLLPARPVRACARWWPLY